MALPDAQLMHQSIEMCHPDEFGHRYFGMAIPSWITSTQSRISRSILDAHFSKWWLSIFGWHHQAKTHAKYAIFNAIRNRGLHHPNDDIDLVPRKPIKASEGCEEDHFEQIALCKNHCSWSVVRKQNVLFWAFFLSLNSPLEFKLPLYRIPYETHTFTKAYIPQRYLAQKMRFCERRRYDRSKRGPIGAIIFIKSSKLAILKDFILLRNFHEAHIRFE